MFLDHYFTATPAGIVISEKQGSDFAKHIAGDFNPIHDEASKRFCVPGDLLFALAVSRYGVRQHMQFRFTGMVGDGVALRFPAAVELVRTVTNEQGKSLLEMAFDGAGRSEEDFCAALIREYVAFSGQNFPHILVPLLADSGVMINPDRPLVIYESMALSFDTLDFNQPHLALSSSSLAVNGKRGDVQLNFDIHGASGKVGQGAKKLAIGGLLPYDEERMQVVIDAFVIRKETWTPGNG
ncbi:MAG: hypothetical protein VR73_10855 [Gammaproteobacteria bacterium BRH_c0]|nr:MAG: hypothetical protein VR73_10855 [Gammaproteobacteria bacterium BRH_c0]